MSDLAQSAPLDCIQRRLCGLCANLVHYSRQQLVCSRLGGPGSSLNKPVKNALSFVIGHRRSTVIVHRDHSHGCVVCVHVLA